MRNPNATASPGEVLVSATVRDMVAGSGITFADEANTLSKDCPTACAFLRLNRHKEVHGRSAVIARGGLPYDPARQSGASHLI
jgi:hypothetical protein